MFTLRISFKTVVYIMHMICIILNISAWNVFHLYGRTYKTIHSKIKLLLKLNNVLEQEIIL